MLESEVTQDTAERVELNIEDDLIFVSVGMYRAFLARGPEGIDAYVLFSHLCFTGKLQHTNSVWANRAYLKKGLKWAQARLDGAMDTLSDMKLISKVKRDGEKGTFGKSYIQVHRTLTPPPVTVDSPKVNGELSVDSTEVRALESAKCLNESLIPKQEIPEGEESASRTSAGSTSEPDSSSPSPLPFQEKMAQKANKPFDASFKAKISGLLLSHSMAEIESAVAACMATAPEKVFYIDADFWKWAPKTPKDSPDPPGFLSTCKVCGSVYQTARTKGCNYCEEHPRAHADAPRDLHLIDRTRRKSA